MQTRHRCFRKHGSKNDKKGGSCGRGGTVSQQLSRYVGPLQRTSGWDTVRYRINHTYTLLLCLEDSRTRKEDHLFRFNHYLSVLRTPTLVTTIQLVDHKPIPYSNPTSDAVWAISLFRRIPPPYVRLRIPYFSLVGALSVPFLHSSTHRPFVCAGVCPATDPTDSLFRSHRPRTTLHPRSLVSPSRNSEPETGWSKVLGNFPKCSDPSYLTFLHSHLRGFLL